MNGKKTGYSEKEEMVAPPVIARSEATRQSQNKIASLTLAMTRISGAHNDKFNNNAMLWSLQEV